MNKGRQTHTISRLFSTTLIVCSSLTSESKRTLNWSLMLHWVLRTVTLTLGTPSKWEVFTAGENRGDATGLRGQPRKSLLPVIHMHLVGSTSLGTLHLSPLPSAIPLNCSTFLVDRTVWQSTSGSMLVKTTSLRNRKQRLFSAHLLTLSVQNKSFLPEPCEGPLILSFLCAGPSHPRNKCFSFSLEILRLNT